MIIRAAISQDAHVDAFIFLIRTQMLTGKLAHRFLNASQTTITQDRKYQIRCGGIPYKLFSSAQAAHFPI